MVMSWQGKKEIESDSYKPMWRYLSKARAEKILDRFKEGKYIEIYSHRDEEGECMPVMVNKFRLIYPITLSSISLVLITIIWFS